MKYVLLVVAFLVLSSSMVCGEEALAIDSSGNVVIENNLKINGRLDVVEESPLPPGFIFGLETKMGSDDNEVIISPGRCRSYVGDRTTNKGTDDPIISTILYGESTNIIVETPIHINLNNIWSDSSTDPSEGRFAETPPLPDTTYHLFVIEKTDEYGNPIVSAGFDSDIDGGSIPSVYKYRRIASFRTKKLNVPAQLQDQYQKGNRFYKGYSWIEDPGLVYYASTPTRADIVKDALVPTGLNLDVVLRVKVNGGHTLGVTICSPDYEADYVSGVLTWQASMHTDGDFHSSSVEIVTTTDSDGMILIRCVSDNSFDDLWISSVGWYDDRGQYGGK